jgi:hypothetical protein
MSMTVHFLRKPFTDMGSQSVSALGTPCVMVVGSTYNVIK